MLGEKEREGLHLFVFPLLLMISNEQSIYYQEERVKQTQRIRFFLDLHEK